MTPTDGLTDEFCEQAAKAFHDEYMKHHRSDYAAFCRKQGADAMRALLSPLLAEAERKGRREALEPIETIRDGWRGRARTHRELERQMPGRSHALCDGVLTECADAISQAIAQPSPAPAPPPTEERER